MAVTITGAAARLGCSVSTVRRLIADGQLIAFQTTTRGRWRVLEEELEAAIERMTDATANEHGDAAQPAQAAELVELRCGMCGAGPWRVERHAVSQFGACPTRSCENRDLLVAQPAREAKGTH